jgi:hypothetical protein
MKLVGSYECSDCKANVQGGDIMAVNGCAPKAQLSMPTGRADAILKTIGDIYCEVR